MFRTILLRSFTWTRLKGNVIQTPKREKLEFKFQHIIGGGVEIRKSSEDKHGHKRFR